MGNWPDGAYIYQRLLEEIGNVTGVCGLMGNLVAESNLVSYVVQGYGRDLEYCRQYTAQVDNGTISEYNFVYKGPNGGGYGLAQWTSHGRKQNLYDYAKKTHNYSIGDKEMQIQFLMIELENSYPSTLAVLKSDATLKEKSDYVLVHFESPLDQSDAVKQQRYEYSLDVYNTYSGLPPIPPGPEPSGKTKFKWWVYMKNPNRRRMEYFGY